VKVARFDVEGNRNDLPGLVGRIVEQTRERLRP
jgi:hypothetical protein